MKKILVLSIAIFSIAVVFNSCKKNSDNNPVTTTSSMKLTLNGTALNYNTCRVQNFTINGSVQTQITGQNAADVSSGSYYFNIVIYSDMNSLKTGDAFQVETSAYEANSMGLSYSPDPSDIFETQAENPQGTVTFTGVGSGFIQGTFSGKLFATTDLAGTNVKYTVTGGSFTAKMQ
jgi:hypothetical protein